MQTIITSAMLVVTASVFAYMLLSRHRKRKPMVWKLYCILFPCAFALLIILRGASLFQALPAFVFLSVMCFIWHYLSPVCRGCGHFHATFGFHRPRFCSRCGKGIH